MSEFFTQKLVNRMIMDSIVDDEQREMYLYTVQLLIDKIFGFIFIYVIAIIFGKVLETTLFLLPFITIRKYSGGYHCEKSLTCLLVSVLMTVCAVQIELNYLIEHKICANTLFVAALFVILMVKSINHPNMNWSKKEYDRSKKISLRNTMIWVMVLVFFDISGIPFQISACIMISIINISFFMLIAKILKQEVKI